MFTSQMIGAKADRNPCLLQSDLTKEGPMIVSILTADKSRMSVDVGGSFDQWQRGFINTWFCNHILNLEIIIMIHVFWMCQQEIALAA